jgi:hypothetical protein
MPYELVMAVCPHDSTLLLGNNGMRNFPMYNTVLQRGIQKLPLLEVVVAKRDLSS